MGFGSNSTGGRFRLSGVLLGVAGVLLAGAVADKSTAHRVRPAAEPVTTGGPASFRRLNEAQYARSIRDIFGEGVKVPGRFDPPLREEGLLAIGDGKVAVSSSGLEQYELRARQISAQVLGAERRDKIVSCKPASATAFDAKCTSEFLGTYGRLLYRRPLTAQELASAALLAKAAATERKDFYKGLEIGLSRLLASPYFIFRVERSVADAGGRRLDDYSLATRISFLLWDAPPDAELLDAAASGALRDEAALARQVDRMLASPRFAEGVRAFFSDMFAYDQFVGLSKDQAIYPKYTSQLAKDAEEQTLRTIVDLLVTQKGDYRDLFTTRRTFMNRNLAALYRVPVEDESVQGWAPYSFAADDPRAGILTLAGFLMLDPTHEGRSSPTIRGKNVRELFLCQKVPPPPPNVNFTIVQDTNDPVHKTARKRLSAHNENPVCAGCHALTDPIGLSMENYDATGAYRTHENGEAIDTTGKFEGKEYRNILDLQRLLHDSPTAATCAVQRAYEYGVGRQPTESEAEWLQYAGDRFAADGYAFPALMRRIAVSRAFRSVAADGKVAMVEPVRPARVHGAGR